jgi:hypothetical protein
MLKRGLPLVMAAATFASDGEDRLDTKVEAFHDRNDVWAFSPILSLSKRIAKHLSLELETQLDAVTGASREWGLSGSGQKLDANTGASVKLDGVSGASAREGGEIDPEIRAGGRAGLSWSNQGRVFAASFYSSRENDYVSYSPSVSGAWDFAERNTTVSWGASWFFDRMTPYGEWGRLGGGAKRVQSYNLGLTQTLTPLSLAGLTTTFTRTTGYIGHPYNPVSTRDSGMLAEELPGAKDALALAGQFVQGFHLADRLGSLNGEYRWYSDSWNLRSHTLTLRWNQHLTDATVVRLQGRYYDQTGAAFASADYTGVERYRTADIRFHPFRSWLAGLKIDSEFPEEWAGWLPRRWDLSYDHLWSDTPGNPLLYQLYAKDAWYMQGTARAGLSWDL